MKKFLLNWLPWILLIFAISTLVYSCRVADEVERTLAPADATKLLSINDGLHEAMDATFSSATDGRNYYKRVRGEWVRDEQTEAALAAGERRAEELLRALQTRVLTDEEFREAVELGSSLNVRNFTPYNAEEKQRERNEAFAQQARLRALADDDYARALAQIERWHDRNNYSVIRLEIDDPRPFRALYPDGKPSDLRFRSAAEVLAHIEKKCSPEAKQAERAQLEAKFNRKWQVVDPAGTP